MEIKAIYLGDVRYDRMPVFTYNEDDDVFYADFEKESGYESYLIVSDDDWIICKQEDDKVTVIDKDLFRKYRKKE